MTNAKTSPARDTAPRTPAAPPSLDPRSLLRGEVARIRAAELGSLPVVAGLIVVWLVFEAVNPVFLTSRNLVQLLLQMAPIGVIALGIVIVLLAGQIDLSVGSMSGVSSAVLTVLLIEHNVPLALAIAAAVLCGSAVGFIYATAVNRLGVPSFVATLAGLLALLGIQLLLLGSSGAINIPFTSFLGRFGNALFVPHWLSYLAVIIVGAAVFASGYALRRSRLRAGLDALPLQLVVLRAAGVVLGLGLAAWYLNTDRGVAWIFVFFVFLVVIFDYLLRRTSWGRSLYAVGGNAEAARRAGINVDRVYMSAFVLCATLAALGGVLFAAYDVSASNQTGTGNINLDAIAAPVIGGTSLFGGRGGAYTALLGMLVIESISNGLALVSPSPDLLYIVTGLVLLLSVGLDSVARRTRRSSGRA